MEKDSQEIDKHVLANKKFGDIFLEGLHLFGRNYGNIVLPFILFLVISNLVTVLLLTDLNWAFYQFDKSHGIAVLVSTMTTDPESITEAELLLVMQSMLFEIGILGFEGIIGAVFTVIAMCSVSNFLYKKYVYGHADFRIELKNAFNKRMVLVILIIGFCVPTGTFFLLFVPGIVIFYYYIFFVQTYNMKDVINPSKEARSIVKGNFLKIIGLFVASVIITTIINIPVQYVLDLAWNLNATTYLTWLNPNSRNFALIFLHRLSYDIVGILLAPLFICILTTLFASSKARYDLGYQKRSYRSQRREYREEEYTPYSSSPRSSETYSKPNDAETATNISEIKEGMYCPFCGVHIKTPRKFCMKCGESLKFD